MLVDELYDLSENTELEKFDLAKINVLIEAINDWPNAVITVEEFLEELQNDQNAGEITTKSIEQRNKKLKMDRDAWKMESYESVFKLIRLCNGKSLNAILVDIMNLGNQSESKQ